MGLVWRFYKCKWKGAKKTKPPRKVQPKRSKSNSGKYGVELRLLHTEYEGLAILELLVLLKIKLLIKLKTHDDTTFLIFC